MPPPPPTRGPPRAVAICALAVAVCALDVAICSGCGSLCLAVAICAFLCFFLDGLHIY